MITDLNNTNKMSEEINKLVTAGNDANKNLFRFKIISRSTKIKLYRNLIRPLVMYILKAWTLTMVGEI